VESRDSKADIQDSGRRLFRVAAEGFVPGSLSLIAAGLLFALGFYTAGVFLLLASAGILLFFRDPERIVSVESGQILSAADGKVIAVEPVVENRYLKADALRISVFMSIFNVHINRAPMDGRAVEVKHINGGFRMAHLEAASLENERTEILLEDESGRRSLMVQIAGLVARRIICRLEPGDQVESGGRFGLICFGSRVDLYLPPKTVPAVKVGDKVKAGLSVLGTLE
jgi:phosphatidylserine decarboxylase